MIVWLLRTAANFAVVGVAALALYAHRDQLAVLVDRGNAPPPEAAARHLPTTAKLATAAGSPAIQFADARPTEAGAAADNQMLRLRADRGGHFFVFGHIDGTAVRFMIDPAAKMVVLSPGDAARAGLSPDEGAFTEMFRTKDGPVRGAAVTLNALRIGTLQLNGLDAVVTERPIGVSILGEPFLRRLKSHAVDGDELVLVW